MFGARGVSDVLKGRGRKKKKKKKNARQEEVKRSGGSVLSPGYYTSYQFIPERSEEGKGCGQMLF